MYSLDLKMLIYRFYLYFRMYQEKLQDFKQQLQNLNSGKKMSAAIKFAFELKIKMDFHCLV